MTAKKIVCGVVAITCVGLLLWRSIRENNRASPPALVDPFKISSDSPKAAPASITRNEPPKAEVPAAPPAIEKNTSANKQQSNLELSRSAQMYAAHASLREPEVANPDSATNRQVLQEMVDKALLRAAAQRSSVRR